MNLLHLKYAIEIAETNSITKAAEKLYTSQPNLSRAVRELESALGVSLFKRTPKGLFPTLEGEEFLGYARNVLLQLDEIEAMFKSSNQNCSKFSISVPRSSCFSEAFCNFEKKINSSLKYEMYYKETNSLKAINNILDGGYKLAIIRYQSIYEQNFIEMLSQKELSYEMIHEFKYKLTISSSSPLAKKDDVELGDLAGYTEIAYPDPFVPSQTFSTVRKKELTPNIEKHIFLYERASQLQLLSESSNMFMWDSRISKELLNRYSLVQKEIKDNNRLYHDMLVYRKGYSLSDNDRLYLSELSKVRNLKNNRQ